MSNYRRYYINGGTWFFTVNLQDRKSGLLTSHIHALRHAIASVKQRKPFHINAWVVLPEHMHCVWTLPENEHDFSSRWREIKKHFSKSLGLRQVWQPRFWEHTIRDEYDYRQHVDYSYINPVKHAWVKQVKDWPFSTFHRDVRHGIYPADWAGEITGLNVGERGD
ncbi:transposase [Citrobacter sp. CK184]|uniref:REP-associated tyrosine transposase n=1 Tax=Citrobacter TaxID=544 RepID=UPI000667010E|nr:MULTISPECIES: transposase [Citrobacter]AVE57288.1 transposase [Citrobacter koseri]EKU0539863.1 transposase [Citrobacter koseri]EKU8894216.1 transposase [Citrobacter koseri]EKW5655877.1 transposase [Citrobacter koseri]EKY0739888.1 transposase [Citrobacter koseri]